MRLCRVLDVEVRPNPKDPIFYFHHPVIFRASSDFWFANKGNRPIRLFDGFELSHGMIKSRNHASTTTKDEPFTSGGKHSIEFGPCRESPFVYVKTLIGVMLRLVPKVSRL